MGLNKDSEQIEKIIELISRPQMSSSPLRKDFENLLIGHPCRDEIIKQTASLNSDDNFYILASVLARGLKIHEDMINEYSELYRGSLDYIDRGISDVTSYSESILAHILSTERRLKKVQQNQVEIHKILNTKTLWQRFVDRVLMILRLK